MEVDGVIENPVIVGLGADKQSMEEGVTEAKASVQQEAIAVEMCGTTGEIAVSGWVIEKCALAAHPGLKVGSVFLGQAGVVNGVDVVDEGAELLEAVIGSLVISEGNFGAVAVMIVEGALDAEAGVDAALLSGRQERIGSRCVSGGEKSAATDGKIELLGMSERGKGKRKKRTHRHQSRELSQIQPPFRFVR